MQNLFLGITGASGSIYAQTLLEFLKPRVQHIHVIFTPNGRQVCHYELPKGSPLLKISKPGLYDNVRVYRPDDGFAPIASSGSVPDGGWILPCSVGLLARVSLGQSSTLMERACDVMLREKKTLIFGVREAPFSLIHLKNMVNITQAGGEIFPLAPGFYYHPSSLDDLVHFIVGRMVERLGFTHNFYRPWGSSSREE